MEININNAVEYQTIQGFGATHLGLTLESLGDVLSTGARVEAINAAYSQVGLNTGNLEVALLESPGSYSQRTNDTNDAFNIDWNRFQTFRVDAMKEKVNHEQSAGEYSVSWDGTDGNGLRVPSAVYVYELNAGGFISTKKAILLKKAIKIRSGVPCSGLES